MREVFLDFEFCRTTEPQVNLVSCATFDEKKNKSIKWWLHNDKRVQRELVKYLEKFELVSGYACVSEARSFLALDLEPLQFKWYDMFLEYRMMTNHNDDLQWGKQLVDGKVKFFSKPRPKWQREEDESAMGFKASHSLAEATYKLTGEIRDTEHKTAMRNLIISDPKEFKPKQKESILGYNADDVMFLPGIKSRLVEEFLKLAPGVSKEQYFTEAYTRGRYSAHTAHMESRGYPINTKATRNFSKQIPSILAAAQRDINSQFKEKPFKWNCANSRFVWNQKVARQFVSSTGFADKWMKTSGGKKTGPQLSLSLEAFERFYQYKHDYPRENYGAQMVRFLKLKQSLYGFSDSGGKRKNFWDSVGSDGRVRPYMNIYGAQSSRSQPAASGFMFLKPAWMRSLVEPEKGTFIANIDFGQQEFFLSALESEDRNMIAAYLSGDPYLFGAKLARVIPKEGTKATHPIERDTFKNTYLGILYGMTKYGLSIKLTNDTGRKYDEDDAQEQIDLFESSFPDYIEWKEQLMRDYSEGNGICVPDGWRMWSDNDNLRSVCNVPIQGLGASIMRKSVDLAEGRFVPVIFTLHDAIYFQDKIGNEWKIAALARSMREAFQFYYKGTKYFDVAGKIKLDPYAWSPDYKKDSELKINWKGERMLVPSSNLYIDERAISEYERFSKYFVSNDADIL